MAGRDRMTIEGVVRKVLRDQYADVIRESVKTVAPRGHGRRRVPWRSRRPSGHVRCYGRTGLDVQGVHSPPVP